MESAPSAQNGQDLQENLKNDLSMSNGSEKSLQEVSNTALPSPGVTDLSTQAGDLTIAASATSTTLDPKEALKLELQNERIAQRERAKQERLRAKEEEKQLKLKQREAEKLERERKKEEERVAKELKKQQDALERERKKQEEKERKEQEKLLKKQLQEEERLLKREEKKRKLEEEHKRKEDEKRRKEERSQMRISSFFSTSLSAKPADPVKSSPTKSEAKSRSYENDFLPFFQKSNVIMAENGSLRADELESRKAAFDVALKSAPAETLDCLGSITLATSPGDYTTTQKLVEGLNSPNYTEAMVVQLVNRLPPIKYLQFYENSKPPYVGTWCSEDHMKVSLTHLNPLDTELTGYDYGYDSDLDWQDEGEGEDIDDMDDGEDEEEDGDDDMDDFVENTDLLKKRGLVGPPQQAITIWNGGNTDNNGLFDSMKFESLDLGMDFPIDPFKNYWSMPKTTSSNVEVSLGANKPGVVAAKSSVEAPNVLTPQKPVIKDPKVVEDLIKFIEKNSDFTIGTLTELAKKEFSTYTKSILKYTIQSVAVYNKKENGWKIKEVQG